MLKYQAYLLKGYYKIIHYFCMKTCFVTCKNLKEKVLANISLMEGDFKGSYAD